MRRLASVAVLLIAFAGGCGGQGDQTAAPPGRDHDDVTFLQAMIPHHAQAVEMSALAAGNAADLRVKMLAQRIEAAQQPEIDEMKALLESWGVPTTIAPHQSEDHGMQSHEGIDELRTSTGGAFDRRFLQMMIDHHEGAIEAANREIGAGTDPEVVALAGRIRDAQKAEVEEMKSILGSLAP